MLYQLRRRSSDGGSVGLVSAMPSGPGVISEALIAQITEELPTTVDSFLLTSETAPQRIIDQHRRCGTTTIQLCDRLAPGTHTELRAGLPGVRLVQVVHVTGPEALTEAEWLYPQVDALLLDSGNPTLDVKELGGTGRTHDWTLSRAIASASPIPVWLAGGLDPTNVEQAIAAVQPHGVDLCSGVRREGRLDGDKLEAFMEVAHRFPPSRTPN